MRWAGLTTKNKYSEPLSVNILPFQLGGRVGKSGGRVVDSKIIQQEKPNSKWLGGREIVKPRCSSIFGYKWGVFWSGTPKITYCIFGGISPPKIVPFLSAFFYEFGGGGAF